MLRAVILAAGRGSRLAPVVDDAPKCLLPVGGVTMLERQIHQLRSAGVDEIVAVVGCQADRVRRIIGASVHYVENTRFAQTNSLYSLWLARPLLGDGFVVLNCDVLFHPQLLIDLLTARHEAAAMIAYCGEATAVGEEEMKVKVRRGRVTDFSKQMPPAEADGENVGMLKFEGPAARLLVAEMDRLVVDGHTLDWAPRAFAAFAARHPLHALGTRGFPWIEIDFPGDYDRARAEILPMIEPVPVGVHASLPFEAADAPFGTDARLPVDEVGALVAAGEETK